MILEATIKSKLAGSFQRRSGALVLIMMWINYKIDDPPQSILFASAEFNGDNFLAGSTSGKCCFSFDDIPQIMMKNIHLQLLVRRIREKYDSCLCPDCLKKRIK